jgi:hypothetical protein
MALLSAEVKKEEVKRSTTQIMQSTDVLRSWFETVVRANGQHNLHDYITGE